MHFPDICKYFPNPCHYWKRVSLIKLACFRLQIGLLGKSLHDYQHPQYIPVKYVIFSFIVTPNRRISYSHLLRCTLLGWVDIWQGLHNKVWWGTPITHNQCKCAAFMGRLFMTRLDIASPKNCYQDGTLSELGLGCLPRKGQHNILAQCCMATAIYSNR